MFRQAIFRISIYGTFNELLICLGALRHVKQQRFPPLQEALVWCYDVHDVSGR